MTTKSAILVALLLIVGVGVWYLAPRLDIAQAHYESYEDALVGIEAGWLPAWLPKSATSIRESHNIDTNECFVMFDFVPTERFYATCQEVAAGGLIFPRPEQKERFSDFVTDSLRLIHEDESLSFFRCEGRSTRALAVEAVSGRAYSWDH